MFKDGTNLRGNKRQKTITILDFVIEHHDGIGLLNLVILNMPVLSITIQSSAPHGVYEGNLSLYRDFDHPLGWQRVDVRKFLEKTFKKHPTVAAILQRTSDFFTPNHVPFFVFNKGY